VASFVFTILSGPDDDALELAPCEACEITQPMWAELAGQMAGEPALLPFLAATLAARAEAGYAAVALRQSHIVSHVALVPLGCRAGSHAAAHTWTGLLAAAGLGAAQLPSFDVYDCAGSWTAPAWRGKGVSMALHSPLLAHWLAGGSLGVSGTSGTTSRRLAQLGWQILGWSAAPFVSSLIGIPLAGFEDCVDVAWQPPAGRARYDGPPINPSDLSHAWSQYCYFWVSSAALARRLDGQLAELCRGDLQCWRRAILEVFSQPGAWHRVALLP
jgi:hypothetical protein